MIITREMFSAEAALAAAVDGQRVIADRETGTVAGQVAPWDACLRGTGRGVCRSVSPDTLDTTAFGEALAATTDDGELIRCGGLAIGPAHPDTRRRDADMLMHEMMSPTNLAAMVAPHVAPTGLAVAGVIAPEAIERYGDLTSAADAINRTAFSIHAGPTTDGRPGSLELWGVVGVISPGLPSRASRLALAAACSDGEDGPCESCAQRADDDLDALADMIAERLDQRAEQRRLRADIAQRAPLR